MLYFVNLEEYSSFHSFLSQYLLGLLERTRFSVTVHFVGWPNGWSEITWSQGLLGALNRTQWETSYFWQLLHLPSSVKVSLQWDLLIRLFCLHIQYIPVSSMLPFQNKRNWHKSLTVETKDLALLFQGLPLDTVLNQSDVPPNLNMYPPNIHLKLVLQYPPLFSSKWPFLRGYHTKILYGIFVFLSLLLCIFIHITYLMLLATVLTYAVRSSSKVS